MVNASYNPTTAAADPFTGTSQAAIDLREAFALAIDNKSLANIVCDNLVCIPATGGLITKGLTGYAGDGTDPLAKFDANKAKQLLQTAEQLNPSYTNRCSTSRTSYNNVGLNDGVAQFLQGDWQTNLGIHVSILGQTQPPFIGNRLKGDYMMTPRRLAVRLQPPAGLVRQPLGQGRAECEREHHRL